MNGWWPRVVSQASINYLQPKLLVQSGMDFIQVSQELFHTSEIYLIKTMVPLLSGYILFFTGSVFWLNFATGVMMYRTVSFDDSFYISYVICVNIRTIISAPNNHFRPFQSSTKQSRQFFHRGFKISFSLRLSRLCGHMCVVYSLWMGALSL